MKYLIDGAFSHVPHKIGPNSIKFCCPDGAQKQKLFVPVLFLHGISSCTIKITTAHMIYSRLTKNHFHFTLFLFCFVFFSKYYSQTSNTARARYCQYVGEMGDGFFEFNTPGILILHGRDQKRKELTWKLAIVHLDIRNGYVDLVLLPELFVAQKSDLRTKAVDGIQLPRVTFGKVHT